MRIQVKLFAILRDRAGVAETSVDVPDGATVCTTSQELALKFPSLSAFLPRVAYAVNREYASSDTVLHDNDELALIPPVSGGAA